MADIDREKRLAAARSIEFVEDGMTVGLGSGSTAQHFIRELGERVRQGMKIQGISTSNLTTSLALQEGIPLTDFDHVRELDVSVDGADEVDPELNLIKGGGGALLREKIVASATRQMIIICDSRKVVESLGSFPLPVEVTPFGWQLTVERIEAMGSEVVVREEEPGRPFLTAQNNYILDCSFNKIGDPCGLARQLEGVTGVVEHGLFVALTDLVIVGQGDQTEILTARR
jgi:ribose 5-phosphate isomerase A